MGQCRWTHIRITVDSFLFVSLKRPTKAESLRATWPFIFLCRDPSLWLFPLQTYKIPNSYDLKTLVLVYSKARALKLKCCRGDAVCHKTVMKMSHRAHCPLKKRKEKNAICDLGHQTNCRTYECHLTQEQTKISPHCTKLIYAFFLSSYQ